MTKFQVVNNLPNDSYHSDFPDFDSSTWIKNFTTSQKNALYEKQKEKVSKPHFELGNICHTMISSFHPKGIAFDEEYSIFASPINDKTGKPYGADTVKMQEAKAEALSNANGKLLCSEEDKAFAKMLCEQLITDDTHVSHEFFNKMFQRGTPEVSYFAKDFIEGLNLRIRPDLDGGVSVSGKSFICDYKFMDDIEKFAYKISEFGYDISAAMYVEVKKKYMREVLNIDEPIVDFYWIVVDKKAPCDWIIVSAENFMFSATEKFYQCLNMLKETKETGIYKGVSAYCPNRHGIFKPKPSFRSAALNPLLVDNEGI